MNSRIDGAAQSALKKLEAAANLQGENGGVVLTARECSAILAHIDERSKDQAAHHSAASLPNSYSSKAWVMIPRDPIGALPILHALSDAGGFERLPDPGNRKGDYPITGKQSTVRIMYEAVLSAASSLNPEGQTDPAVIAPPAATRYRSKRSATFPGHGWIYEDGDVAGKLIERPYPGLEVQHLRATTVFPVPTPALGVATKLGGKDDASGCFKVMLGEKEYVRHDGLYVAWFEGRDPRTGATRRQHRTVTSAAIRSRIDDAISAMLENGKAP